MKISLVSDLHLEFGYQSLPGGDVLILAGDVAEARSISKHHHSTKLLSDEPDEHYRCSEFFYHECAKYKKVFYVMGNHEHYHNKFWKTYEELKSVIPDNVSLLENQHEVYEGICFVGATLWTDMNRSDPVTLTAMKTYMNDYRLITYHYPEYDTYHKMDPMDTVRIHYKSKEYIKQTVQQYQDMPVVVITHMAPSFASVSERFRHDRISNGAYASDLSHLILDNPNIRVWCHGHMHDATDYMIGDTRVVSNPRGYVGYEDTDGFDPNFSFEL